MSLIKQHEAAFRKAYNLRGSDWSIHGEEFKAVRGKYAPEGTGVFDSDEFVESAGIFAMQSLNLFTVACLRSMFPTELLQDNGRVTFNNGTVIANVRENENYNVEAINDNPESLWIKLSFRES